MTRLLFWLLAAGAGAVGVAVFFVLRRWWLGWRGLNQWPKPYGRYYDEWLRLTDDQGDYYEWLAKKMGGRGVWPVWALYEEEVREMHRKVHRLGRGRGLSEAALAGMAVDRKFRQVPRGKVFCELRRSLRRDLHAGILTNFVTAFNNYSSGAGLCHDVLRALIGDLRAAQHEVGWRWVAGWVRGTDGVTRVADSWVEYRGWVLKILPGECVAAPAAEFYARVNAAEMTDEEIRSEFPEMCGSDRP
jgi:hypothetical protein